MKYPWISSVIQALVVSMRLEQIIRQFRARVAQPQPSSSTSRPPSRHRTGPATESPKSFKSVPLRRWDRMLDYSETVLRVAGAVVIITSIVASSERQRLAANGDHDPNGLLVFGLPLVRYISIDTLQSKLRPWPLIRRCTGLHSGSLDRHERVRQP